MSISPALRLAYSAHRAHKLSNRDRTARTASAALSFARQDVESGRNPVAPRPSYLGHGDVIRSRTATGERRTYVVAIIPDQDMGAPWEEHDGHGVIREVGRGRQKAPGEVLFSSGDRHGTVYAYDVPASLALARADGWGLRDDHRAALEKRLGRKPTAREVTAEAVRLDLDRCRDWLCDRWSWIGVGLVEMPRDGECRYPDSVADGWAEHGDHSDPLAASLWGIESDSPDYRHAVALELVREANAA